LNFVVWGLFHGAFLAAERLLEPVTARAPTWLRPFGHVYTLVAVGLSWVVFRCDTWPQAWSYVRSMLGAGAAGGLTSIPASVVTTGVLYAATAGVLLCFPWWPALRARAARWKAADHTLEAGEACTSLAVLFLCLLALGAGSHNPFIYYRF